MRKSMRDFDDLMAVYVVPAFGAIVLGSFAVAALCGVALCVNFTLHALGAL